MDAEDSMRICRFVYQGQPRWGRIEDRGVEPWIVALAEAPPEDLAHQLAPSPGQFSPQPLDAVVILQPVVPSKIVCVGRNYSDHAKELGNELPAEPLLFFKPVSSLLPPGGVVRMPAVAERVDFEGELALVIARRANKVKAAEWRDYVRGYTLANDVTARDLQKKDGQWTRAKGFDTFCPVGPILTDEIDPEGGLTIETRVNGELRQHGSTTDFIFGIGKLLEYITAAITLEAGDLVLTGTPAGVGPLKPGDVVEVSMAGIGRLTNSFAPEQEH